MTAMSSPSGSIIECTAKHDPPPPPRALVHIDMLFLDRILVPTRVEYAALDVAAGGNCKDFSRSAYPGGEKIVESCRGLMQGQGEGKPTEEMCKVCLVKNIVTVLLACEMVALQ